MLAETGIFNKVVEICSTCEHNNKPVIVKSIDESLYDDLGLDSLAVVEIVMLCENEFGIVVDDEAITKLRTIKDLVEIINKSLDNGKN